MTIQIRSDNNNEPFVLDDSAEVLNGITLAANQGDITTGAVLGEVDATPGTYKVVNIAVAASDGSQLPKLLLATPDVASDASPTTNLSAYSSGLFNENQLVFASDGSVDLDSRIQLETGSEITMRQALRMFDIRVAPCLSDSGYQNPVI